jgi:hypothetical protein
MKTNEQIMADLLRSQQNSRAQGQQIQQMMAGEGYRPQTMSPNLPQTMSPNMINQSAGMRPGRTGVGQGRAAALAAQMRQAQANMSGDPAQGKTVSNGRIYVAPTWSEVLADGVKKGLGGYSAGQAREGLIEIDEEQAAEDAMNAEYEAMLLAQEMARKDEENAQAQLNVENKAGALIEAAKLKEYGLDKRAEIRAANSSLNVPKKSGAQPTKYKLADGTNAFVTMIDGKPVNIDTDEIVALTGAVVMDKERKFYGPETKLEKETWDKAGNKSRESINLLKTFKDDYSTPAALRFFDKTSKLESALEGSFGLGTDGQSSYWSGVAKAELEPRHDLFGSAFTAPEQIAYNATTITEKLRPEEIRKRLAKRVEMDVSADRRQAAAAFEKGFNPREIKMKYGDTVDVDQLQDDMDSGVFDVEMDKRQAMEREWLEEHPLGTLKEKAEGETWEENGVQYRMHNGVVEKFVTES